MIAKPAKPELPDLSGFHGSEVRYRHRLLGVLYTGGVEHLAKTVGAYWMIDTIAAHNAHTAQVKNHRFQVWKLIVRIDGSAVWRVEDGDDRLIFSDEIPFTDFPDGGITLWCIRSDDGARTIMLPSEY